MTYEDAVKRWNGFCQACDKVSPYALSHDYAPPVSLMPAIGEGRCAVIAKGNSPEEISRAACLDLNARILEIADRAAYALPGEVRWLK